LSFRLAIVQPITHAPPEDELNVADAVRAVEGAAGHGANFVVFPESYPGPWRMPRRFDPTGKMVEAARRCKTYVQFGTLEPIDDSAGTAYQLSVLAGPDGTEPAVYRRTHPPGPWLYTGGRYWEFQYVAADDFPVFETDYGIVGLAVCSEVYVPEVTRALALRGAEIILLPAGIDKRELWATWRTLIWARAIENLALVVTTQNLFSARERGLAMVVDPEQILFESTAPGIFYVDVDLERARRLRREEDGVASTNASKAGLLSQWQRPELYPQLLPSGHPTTRRPA
jgi:predicted amidohydrolase